MRCDLGRQRAVVEIPGEEDPVSISVHKRVLNISFGQASVYTFEPSGRFYGAFDCGRNYRRGLDNRILEKWRVRRDGQSVLHQRWLDTDSHKEFLAGVCQRVKHVAGSVKKDEFAGHFDAILKWDPDAYEHDAALFSQVYKPISILPPDQYMAVVIQATEGCSWNQCTFCDFYRDRKFRIRSPGELDTHIADVKDFMGSGISMRRSIFLGDANVLSIPWDRLQETFESIQKGFPSNADGPSWHETYAFVDAWGGQKRTVDQVVALKSMGLQRVYLGLETGNDALLERVNKRGNARSAIETVKSFKAAGVSVGVIVLLGIGGASYAHDHVWDTVDVLNAMNLGRSDIIYFSELISSTYLPYAQDMWAAGIHPLSQEQMTEQREIIEEQLIFHGQGRPKIAPYDIRRFVY
ncbi:MAG: radical SAM protein [Candidatus Latescibacteria bacterium]|nr:radical SAM protein [Candidatus Latescibacterota bacterium]